MITGQSKAKKNKGTSVIETINQNNSLIFIAFCFLLGVLIGALIFRLKGAEGEYYKYEFEKVYIGLGGGFFSALKTAFVTVAPFVAGIFLSGTCMVGSVLVPLIVLLKGILEGLIMSYCYANFGLMGIIFSLLILVPAASISGMALILSAREALGFSLSLARLAMPDSSAPKISKDFKLYCLRQIFMLLFFAAGVFVQVLMSMAFIKFFNLT